MTLSIGLSNVLGSDPAWYPRKSFSSTMNTGRGSSSVAPLISSADSKPMALKLFCRPSFWKVASARAAASLVSPISRSALRVRVPWASVSAAVINQTNVNKKMFIPAALLFCDVVIIVPVRVIRAAHVIVIRFGVLIADVGRPRIVHRNVIHAVDGDVTGGDHHVTAPAGPVPGKRKRLALAVNLILYLLPGQRRIGGFCKRESVFVEFRPAAVHAVAGNGRVATIASAKAFVCFITLRYAHTEETHDHLPAGGPAPHRGLLGVQVNSL